MLSYQTSSIPSSHSIYAPNWRNSHTDGTRLRGYMANSPSGHIETTSASAYAAKEEQQEMTEDEPYGLSERTLVATNRVRDPTTGGWQGMGWWILDVKWIYIDHALCDVCGKDVPCAARSRRCFPHAHPSGGLCSRAQQFGASIEQLDGEGMRFGDRSRSVPQYMWRQRQ